MQNQKSNASCTAILGSVTQAMRAQRALASAAILSEVRKVDAASGRRGCAYGIEYSCKEATSKLSWKGQASACAPTGRETENDLSGQRRDQLSKASSGH